MKTLLDQYGDTLMRLGAPQLSYQPTAVVISVDPQGNLVLEQKLQPGVVLDPDNPAHRLANFITTRAPELLAAAFEVPMQVPEQRVIQLN